ncbi:MAG: trypsin-like serine protease [Lachnospiraceae bacterium]|nr:trypsin-like serine protease [Lachnospiraceae bacterium]
MKQSEIKKRAAALLLGICLAVMACTGCAGQGKTGYTDAKNGVAVVGEYLAVTGAEKEGEHVTLNTEAEMLAHGSGFFIGKSGQGPQYLITNYHVIEDYMNFGAGQNVSLEGDEGIVYYVKSYLRVYFDASDYEEAYVVDYSEAADVAVLKLESPTDKRKALRIEVPSGDMAGTNVYAIGFPQVSDNAAVDAITSWGPEDVTFTSGIISRLTTTSGTGVQSIQIDVNIGHGNSGGPLVNEAGNVLGINTWGVTNTSAETAMYAVNIEEAVRLLKLHNIPFEEGAGSGGGRTVLLIGIGAGILLVAAVVLLLVLWAGKKKAGSAGNGQREQISSGHVSFSKTVPGSSANPEAGTESKAGLEAGTGRKAVLEAGTEDKAVHDGGTPSAKGRETVYDSGYRLQGVSGALEGRRFMIRRDTPLILGRNGEICNVVFPAGTPGVSGSHCQIWFEEGVIYIRDLGSSHGTFLASGARLASGQSLVLKPGESFSLGSGNETLVLVQKGGL